MNVHAQGPDQQEHDDHAHAEQDEADERVEDVDGDGLPPLPPGEEYECDATDVEGKQKKHAADEPENLAHNRTADDRGKGGTDEQEADHAVDPGAGGHDAEGEA